MIRAPSQSRAGASNRPSASRPCQRLSIADSGILTLRSATRREAYRPGGIEAEYHFLPRLEIRKLPGLGQRYAKFAASACFLKKNRRIRPIEQHALHFSRMPRLVGRQLRLAARESGDFGTHEYLDGAAQGRRADLERAHDPTIGGGNFSD